MLTNRLDSFLDDQGGFGPAIANILIAGQPVVEGILANWNEFEGGIPPQDGFLSNADDLHSLAPQRKRRVSTRMRG